MSTILALDSSTDACSVALRHQGRTVSLFEIASKSHTQRLLPMVDELLCQAGLRVTDLDAIAFGRGPGSFTGLRICAGIVQGLAFGSQRPVVPVSTLEAMAKRFVDTNPSADLPILAALDARMGEIYWGLYQASTDARGISVLTEESVSAPNLAALQTQHQSVIGVGSGWNYPELQALAPTICEIDWHPRAQEIVALAEVQFKGQGGVSPADAQPVYLRDTVSWQKRTRIRNSDH